ncbi:kinase-like protein, partial [Gonapodya prolifera JEL478]
MVFALATGGELFDRVVARGRLTERDSALILATLCNVLSFLHAHGIVHRDLRTKNMVFKDPSPNSPLLLVDFGIANRIEGNRERLRTQIGTPLYTAPEVWDGDGYGTPADMFSLGIIAHTLLTGSPPTWTGGKVRRLAFPHPAWRVLSPESRNFVKELLSMSPFTRMTAERAMDHPWLRKFLSKEEISRLHQVNSEAFISTGPPRNLETLMPG